MKLPLLLLLIQSCALVARATPARHWRRAPAHGVFNVDVYAYNKPRMNLVRRQASGSRSTQDAPPLDHMLQQISHHSRRSSEQRSHYRNLDEDTQVLPMPLASELNKTIESPAINMQLMPLQMNSALHARENLYSNEFHVQSVGTKKIVQLNTLTSDHERKPVVEEVMAQKQQEQEQEQEPLKVKLTLPELPENNAEEIEVLPGRSKVGEVNAAGTAPAGESVTSVKKPMAPSETIIDKPSTGMQQVVSPTTEENAGDTGTMAQSGQIKKDEPKARPPRPKSKRKQKPTGAPTSNETEVKMTANRVVTAPVPGAVRPGTNPIRGPGSGPLNAKQPAKELETQSLSPEISTHRPLTTKSRGNGKGKGKGKGKDKRRQGSQRRPAIAGVMEEEIETTTNWWQILPYAEIRKFLNTIYDTIADDGDDERATLDV
ncbi:uncharacterized protein LOC6547638 [Drosophila erecta]|uniref:Uncharacterized protein n=1 Tax=Drosophila erecta TaxID=7220 RepID=B3NK32_DROER|nr:uncharacterized protein LOC6547638 [Drosophila erecta]EDV55355.1 uncharacterized protein Dere_GG22059 [Drosophila erecta]